MQECHLNAYIGVVGLELLQLYGSKKHCKMAFMSCLWSVKKQ